MPYKNKEDRTDAVRRYRNKEKITESNQKWIGNFLTEHCHFETMPFSYLVEKIQEECVLEDGSIRLRSSGELMERTDVHVGLNMVVLVETVHVTDTRD
ncbi:hypothetical protein ACFLS8_04565 [Chloroflexota bacterium]